MRQLGNKYNPNKHARGAERSNNRKQEQLNMETLTQEKGLLETPQVHELSLNQPAVTVGTEAKPNWYQHPALAVAQASGTVALAGEIGQPATPASTESPRYGYRQDSPPEVIALLHQAQAGNTEAFADLYRLHLDRVNRYVTARMWNEDRQAIPDVVQDTFCEAFADLGNAHNDVKGWLLAHAAKAYIRYVRSDRQQGRAIKAAKEAVRREYACGYARQHRGTETLATIGHAMLVHALARLAPSQREVVQHRYLDGQSQATTAMLMGKKLKTAKSVEYRALAKLREGLA